MVAASIFLACTAFVIKPIPYILTEAVGTKKQ
jgi:hypothetical protein